MRIPILIALLTLAPSLSAVAAEQTTVRQHPSIDLGQDRLIAYYPFNGDASDASGNELNPIGSSELSYVDGQVGKALALDGRTFIELPLDLNPELFEEIKVTYLLRLDALPEDAEVLKALQPKSYVLSNAYQGLSSIQDVKGNPRLSAHNSGATAGTDYKHRIPRERWVNVRIISALVAGENAEGEPETRIRVQLDSDNYSDVSEQVYRPGTTYQTLIVGAFDKKAGWATRGAIDELRIFASGATEAEDAIFRQASRVSAIPQEIESTVASVTPIRRQLPAPATGFDQNADLIAHFPFDGDATSAVGGVSTLSSVGTSATTGRIGQALQFDGASFLELPLDLSHTVYPDQTISVWIKPDSTNGLAKEELDVIGNSAYPLSNSYHGLLHLSSPKENAYMRGVSGGVIAGHNRKHRSVPDTWTHVAIVSRLVDARDADGKPQKQIETEVHSGPYITSNRRAFRDGSTSPTLTVGAWNSSAAYGFRGAIDDLRIYSRALGAEEVLALATSAPRAGEASPLAGLGANEDVTEVADISSVPDVVPSDVQDRLDDVERVAVTPDWQVKRIVDVKPRSGVPGDVIRIRVALEKHDPLNAMANATLSAVGSIDYTPIELNTSVEYPRNYVEEFAYWTIPNDLEFGGQERIDTDFSVSVFGADEQDLHDRDPDNNTLSATLRVFNPSIEICGVLSFWDTRQSRSNATGSRLVEASIKTEVPLGGVYLDVLQEAGACKDTWESCTENDDRLIKKTKSGLFDGRFCARVPRPSTIYLRSQLYTSIASIRGADGSQPVISSFREFIGPSDVPTINWSASCPSDDDLCNEDRATKSSNEQTVRWANTLATLVDVERHYASRNLISPKIDIYVNPDAPEECADAFEGKNNQARQGKTLCVYTPNANHRVAHEVGHIVMHRALKISSKFMADCDGNSGWATEDNEKCATSEGFANFFAASVFWEQAAVDPFYHEIGDVLEGKTTRGNNKTKESCVGKSGDPHRIEGNVTRFFWDLYDQNGDTDGSYTDDTNVSVKTIVDQWAEFDQGESDREAEEGSLKSNGRNAWDYLCRFEESRSELLLNCLDEQEGVVPLTDVNSSCIY